MRNMHRDLRPCPFCGGEKLRWHINYLSVTCENCGAYWYDSRKLSLDGWNNRPIEDKLNERIDELILRGNDLLDDLCWSDTVNPENEKTINAWVDITEHIRPKERE